MHDAAPARAGGLQDHAIPALTGLRFLAAISVVVAHSVHPLIKYQPPGEFVSWLEKTSSFGMTLFFVLSGFVIHYNYRNTVTAGGWTGIAAFAWARFARLYPLFLFLLVLNIFLGQQFMSFLRGEEQSFTDAMQAMPYYLLFIQSWLYTPLDHISLIHAGGPYLGLTWSISTEWFFYMAYPLIARPVLRARRPAVILGGILIWSIVWIGLAATVDRNSRAIDAWAVGRYGAFAGAAHPGGGSFVQWLEYYSPYLRIGEFVLGCLVAQLFLQLRSRPVVAGERLLGSFLTAIGFFTVPLLVYSFYGAGFQVPILQNACMNYGLAPSIGLILFGAVRYDTIVSRVLRLRPLLALGEASYSLYMIHLPIMMIITGSFLGYYLPATPLNLLYFAFRWCFVLALICLIATGLHAIVEVPARRWLRGLWGAGCERPAAAISIAALPAGAALGCLVVLGYL